jgi:hypothetical protein
VQAGVPGLMSSDASPVLGSQGFKNRLVQLVSVYTWNDLPSMGLSVRWTWSLHPY